jgi:hypothetical protein
MRLLRLLLPCLPLVLAPAILAQDTAAPSETRLLQQVAPPQPAKPEKKRIFGIIPNYRTYPTLDQYEPISSEEKFKIMAQDGFDRGSFMLAAAFAGEAQLTNNTPSYGQGVAGYARYFGAAYGDILIGDFMTEALYPSLLHEDPRYFRRGTGSGPSRAWFAIRQLFWTRTDSGRYTFNVSEVGGNATAAAISNLYYPDNRTAGAAAAKLAIQIGIDAAGNLLKEFWPDIDRKFHRQKDTSHDAGSYVAASAFKNAAALASDSASSSSGTDSAVMPQPAR